MAEDKSKGDTPTVIIQLDRSSQVYYPGEVVRGIAILDIPCDSTCRDGVFLDYHASADTDWIRAARDDEERKIFSGETVFQHRIWTIVGDTFQTGALRTTGQKSGANFQGEAIDFDRIPGVGEVYIPCSNAEQKRLKLKVTCMSATAKVDVPTLIEDGGTKQYFLTTTTGNMTRGPIKLSAVFIPYDSVYGEALDKSDWYCKIQIHQVKSVPRGTKNVGVLITKLQQRPESPAKVSSDSESNVVKLTAGKYQCPFHFKLRDDSPGSAQFQVGEDTASITYSLKGYVGLNQKELSQRVIFTVIPNRPLPRAKLLSPHHMETGDQPVFKSNGFCRPKGMVYTVSIKFTLGRLAYAPGEVIEFMRGEVINRSSIDQPAQIVLRTFVRQDCGYNQIHSFAEDHILFECDIPAKETVILGNLPAWRTIRVPPLPPSYSGVFLDSDQNNRYNACIKWAYTLEVRLPSWGTGFYCRSPLLICASPPWSYQLQEYRNKRSDPELTDHWSIFSHAVSGVVKPYEIGPTLRRPSDDKGARVVAKQSQPQWLGSSQAYDRWIQVESNRERLKRWVAHKGNGEDFADLMTMFYRPIVSTFAGPSGRLNIDE